MKANNPLQSYAWWINDLREAETRSKVVRIGKHLLECEVTKEEARTISEVIDAQLKWPRSQKERRLIEAWESRVADLQSSARLKS